MAGGGEDRGGDRVLRPRLCRGRHGQRVRVALDAGDPHPARGQGAGLVQHHGVDPPGPLQHLTGLDQHPQAGTAAGADHDGRRGGQPHGARAGHDEHRHRGGEGPAQVPAEDEPAGEGDGRDRDDGGHEHRGDAVGQPLHRRLGRLGRLHQAHDAGQRGVRAHRRAIVHC
jgi:hypothetical protein